MIKVKHLGQFVYHFC